MTKILLIDDEEDFCYFVKENLQLISNYEIIIALDGKKGLKAARQHKPDIILLDIMMSQMDGFTVLKKLKEDKKTVSIPVIMLTAKDDDESKTELANLDCEDYIVKPVETKALKAKIEDVLARRMGNRARW